jgi:bifunctional non-homologous end joining protein LigD
MHGQDGQSGRRPRTAQARAEMPALVRPMLATLGELPPSGVDDDFAYETKFDGVRAIAYVARGRLRLMTRNDIDVTVAYPEVGDLGAAMGPVEVVLDGELVTFAPHTGQSSFAALQPRIHLRDRRAIARMVEQVPVTYCLFDVLFLDGRSTMELSYDQRRVLLDGLELDGPYWRTPSYHRGGGANELAESRRRGDEGILAKRLTSRYEPGRRSREWIKVKNLRTQEVVIGGWSPGQGARSGTIGSLLLGIPDGAGLSYVGKVGTGFTQQMLASLYERLRRQERPTSPFTEEVPRSDARDAHWVTPTLVGEVQFGEWTRDGRLRQPSWRGERPDKAPDEIVRES